MKKLFKKEVDPIALVGLILTIVLAVPALLDWFKITPKDMLRPVFYYGLPVTGLVIISVFVYLTISRLNRLYQTFNKIHLVSHKLRTALHESIVRKTDSAELQEAKEMHTLEDVCNQIEMLFSKLVHDDCVVCVTFVSVKDKELCFLAAHSASLLNKAAFEEIKISQATRLHKVHVYDQSDGENVLHYYSADVTKETDYKDPNREHQPYRATIVVPIRCACITDHQVFLGFLKVQTAKPRRLNDEWHVKLIGAFADQIFLFLEANRALRSRQISPVKTL